MYARIAGTGRYLPERVLTNDELAKSVDTSDEWIRARTGIRQRHIAADNETTCDLAERAARAAIDSAGIKPDDVDLIVVATTTPDLVFPSTACLLQQRLDIHGCPAFDVQAVCTGFVYALDVANRYITTGGSRTALVVGAETFSRIIDWKDRSTCVLFGDGAGAVVLKASEKPGIHYSLLHADGAYQKMLWVPSGVSTDFQSVIDGTAYTSMEGREVFKWAVTAMSDVVGELLEPTGFSIDDVDWLVPHQANSRIIQATARKAGVSMDKVIMTVQDHANTSAASIPLALDQAVEDGRIKKGQNIVLEGFGGGFTWGGVLLTW